MDSLQNLTPRQWQILDYLHDFQERHGRTPTGPEIGERFGFGFSTAYDHLRLIEKKGYIELEQTGRRRPLQIRLQPAAMLVLQAAWPRLGAIPAGPLSTLVSEAVEQVQSVEDLLPEIRPGDYFLEVDGDSMIDAGLEEGMTLLMRPVKNLQPGDICAVWVEGEGGTLKRVYQEGDTIRLVPENPRYQPRTYPVDQITIQGVLVLSLAIRHHK
jgi:repressor LexA